MSSKSSGAPLLFLVPIGGPTIDPLRLGVRADGQGGLVLGRHESCDLKLPADAESVSRRHARFRFDTAAKSWLVADMGSGWGTFLNGVKLTPQAELRIGEGDLLRIEPWTFSLTAEPVRRGVMGAEDTDASIVRTFDSAGAAVGAGVRAQPMRDDLLALLLEAAASIHGAATETELANRLLDAAIRGTGMENAAFLRPIDASGQLQVQASHPIPSSASRGFQFSRSLLKAAATGHVAELSADMNQNESIVQMKVVSALCVPLMLGSSPAAYLYLDSRAAGSIRPPSKIRGNATAFCGALGKLASLAFANLKRIDVEKRQAAIEHDLRAAAVAQKWVLPPREMTIGSVRIMGESRSGRYVGGDFFDVINLGDGRVAIALGDVSGKGLEASVLMTATQGFLHAAMLQHGDPGLAITSLNRFVTPRRPDDRFVTLWAATIDPDGQTISYVDAGHGFAMLVGADGEKIPLNRGDGPPLGVSENFEYVRETIRLPPKGRIVVVSDGVVEQPAHLDRTDGKRVAFGMAQVNECLLSAADDPLGELFKQLVHHAGTERLADDATAVVADF